MKKKKHLKNVIKKYDINRRANQKNGSSNRLTVEE